MPRLEVTAWRRGTRSFISAVNRDPILISVAILDGKACVTNRGQNAMYRCCRSSYHASHKSYDIRRPRRTAWTESPEISHVHGSNYTLKPLSLRCPPYLYHPRFLCTMRTLLRPSPKLSMLGNMTSPRLREMKIASI